MKYKRFLLGLSIVLGFSTIILPSATFASGEEDVTLPEQVGTPDGPAIGGGVNSDGEEQQPIAPEKPSQPDSDEPNITEPVPQPDDSNDTNIPTTPDVTPAPEKPAPTVNNSSSKPTTKPTPLVQQGTTTTLPSADESITPETLPITPTAPEDDVSPDLTIDAPHTGSLKSSIVSVNPIAIALLVLSGVTILAAGVVTALLSYAAKAQSLTKQSCHSDNSISICKHWWAIEESNL